MLTTREFQLLRVSFFEYKFFHVSLIRTSLIASRRSLIRTTLFEGSIIRMMRREAELLRQVAIFMHIICIMLTYIVAYMLAARPTRDRLVPGSIPSLCRLLHSAWYPAAALVYINWLYIYIIMYITIYMYNYIYAAAPVWGGHWLFGRSIISRGPP